MDRIKAIFGETFRFNYWGSAASRSGSGSTVEQTQFIQQEIPRLCAELGVRTMLDVPCGDFNWMQHTDLSGIDYCGADIVEELISLNSSRFGVASSRRAFQVLNLCRDRLPTVDLILCRDCLVHLSQREVISALENMCRSRGTYILTTTFPEHADNLSIATGEWHPLNLCAAPFNLPTPLRLMNERCTEEGGRYADKSLGLWRVSDIAESLGVVT